MCCLRLRVLAGACFCGLVWAWGFECKIRGKSGDGRCDTQCGAGEWNPVTGKYVHVHKHVLKFHYLIVKGHEMPAVLLIVPVFVGCLHVPKVEGDVQCLLVVEYLSCLCQFVGPMVFDSGA